MLAKRKMPRLLVSAKGTSEISAVCVACGRIFHAYVRKSEKDTILRLTRNFKLHLRLVHAIIPGEAESLSTLPLRSGRTGSDS